MNIPEVVRRNGLEKNNDAFLRSAAQVHGTVNFATPVVLGRAVRNAEDWQVEPGVRSRQGIQAAAIAMDVRSSRYRRSQADVVRASKNLAEWKKYLPGDCIKAMVVRGWHFTV
jgi:hypothetical protein